MVSARRGDVTAGGGEAGSRNPSGRPKPGRGAGVAGRRRWRTWLAVSGLALADVLATQGAFLLALLLRFSGEIPAQWLRAYGHVALPYTVAALAIYAVLGLYRRAWKYAGTSELVAVAVASVAATFVLIFLLFVYPGGGYSRGTVLFNFFTLTALVGLVRLILHLRAQGEVAATVLPGIRRQGPPTLIAGAGDGGHLAARELKRHPELGYVVGFLDDAPEKRGLRMEGARVEGSLRELAAVVERTRAEALVVAMPSAPLPVRKELVLEARRLGLLVRTLPDLSEVLHGRVQVGLREVQVEDLLKREPIDLDIGSVAGFLRDRTVLITGGGGSIGSEIARQVAQFEPRLLVLLGHGENSIFETALRLRWSCPGLELQEVIADVRDRARIHEVFGVYRPQVIFHAAAYKHVPLMEVNPTEAIKTNIFGTQNVAEAALECGAERFVLISTDKAVNPTSVMGATKRVAELIIQQLNEDSVRANHPTRFTAVRFGNVLGSRGSVVPVFQEQIRRGGPVTVTHPDMQRYFMTIPEAVQLVIQAAAMGSGGEVFVLEMGRPVRILELAEDMIRLSGFEPYTEIPIVFTGRRPGEKLLEEPLTAEEGATATYHRRIYRANVRGPDAGRMHAALERLKVLTSSAGHEQREVLKVLADLLPFGTAEAEPAPSAASPAPPARARLEALEPPPAPV